MVKGKIYLEILDSKRQEVLKKLYQLLNGDYYLAGGTALALQIKHRESLDFDLFRNEEIKFSLKRRILKGFEDDAPQTLVDTSDELSVVLKKEIKLTFVAYWWDPIFPLVKLPGIVPLLSVKDIATTKAYALGRRGNYRDYFDLYVIIKNGHATLKGIVKWCKKKYGEVFSERMFLEQLTYFGDMEADKKLKFLEERYVSPKEMAKFFEKEIKGLR
uniref:Nucleotidyl transferase AbiEii/AbiGii toxin family protein n=1 Tax=candidate division CPR3 bacterium TaxID=2268181 RepID=A0A7V3J9J0_UNCC3